MSRAPIRPTEAAITAAAFGAIAGLGELAFFGLRKFGLGLFLFQPLDTLWLTPLANALLFALLALLWLAIRRLFGRTTPGAQLVGLGAGLATLDLLLLLPPLHQGASLLIGIGVGVQTARLRLASDARVPRLGRRLVAVVAALLAVTAGAIQLAPSVRERRAIAALPSAAGGPNVLIVILDTVRAMSLSAFGYERPTSPNLERWAARGVRFTMAQSTAPWTLPSHGSLFTGREAHELSTDWYVPLDERDPTLAEVLSRHGYLTAGFVANLPYTNREVGLARGFQRYEDWRVSFRQLLVSSMLVRAVTTNERLRELVGTKELIVRKKAPEVNRRFLRWLDRRPARPFFAFLNYYDAHTPFVPPEPYRSRFAPPGAPFHSDLPLRDEDVPWDPRLIEGARNAYDGAIAALDASIGELFDALDQRRLLDSTIVILTSDHGEEFAEHGLFSHGNSLYLPSLHVPMVVWQPGGPAGTSVGTPVSIRDVPATVIDLAGLGELERMPGRSLRRYWTGDSTPTEPLFTEVRHAPKLPAWYPSTKGDLLGAQEGWLRLIRNGDGAIEVYDVARDPLEQHDLAGDSTLAAPIQRLRRLVDEARP